ncbi:MAG: SAM-dependent methyltransferase [Bacteroidetes bacterium]|nr:SAM-dependent methyltransferase [Bacteroidota bacterium]
MSKGKLYIIPVPISEDTFQHVLPDFNRSVVGELRFFVVEKLKTARQFLRKMDPFFPIDDSVFFEQDKHAAYNFHPDVIKLLNEGKNVGLMSESGYAGVADPGTRIVALAHENECEVIPLIGPSSVLLALAASGMNGQGFTFHGYLPKSGNERVQKIKDLVTQIQRTGFAQLFIETPYRNEVLFDDLVKSVPSEIKLTVAYDITGEHQKIQTKKIAGWKNKPFAFDKLPCVFVMGN